MRFLTHLLLTKSGTRADGFQVHPQAGKIAVLVSEQEGRMKTVSVKKVTDFHCLNLELYKIFKNI